MHASVQAAFRSFSVPLEGAPCYPYLDVSGFPTVGIGCLISPLELALPLPWRLADGSAASPSEVCRQWTYLKSQTRLARLGAKYAQGATSIRLTDADVDMLLADRMRANERELLKHFAGWESFPADAQLGIHSMAWAMGAGFAKEFPLFTRSAIAGNWDAARLECTIAGEEKNKGLVPRNVANRVCFTNAARVLKNPKALRASDVYWPLELT